MMSRSARMMIWREAATSGIRADSLRPDNREERKRKNNGDIGERYKLCGPLSRIAHSYAEGESGCLSGGQPVQSTVPNRFHTNRRRYHRVVRTGIGHKSVF